MPKNRWRRRGFPGGPNDVYISETKYWLSIVAEVNIDFDFSIVEGPVYDAITENNLSEVERFFSSPSEDIERCDNELHVTPLAFACVVDETDILPRRLFYVTDRRLKIVEFLIKRGADVNCLCRIPCDMTNLYNDVRPVHLAVYQNDDRLLQLLIKSGANIKVKSHPFELTPLQLAIILNRPRMCEILVEAGSSLNDVDIDGNSPLILACGTANDAISNFILSQNAVDIHLVNIRGWNALHAATFMAGRKIIKRLIQMGASVNTPTEEGFMARDIAEIAGRGKIERLLTDCGGISQVPQHLLTKSNLTPLYGKFSSLHVAARSGELAGVRMLLDEGYDIDARCAFGRTPLAYSVFDNHFEVVDYLLSRNANPNGDPIGHVESPLMRAAFAGSVDIVDKLISHGASTDGNFLLAATAVDYSRCVDLGYLVRKHRTIILLIKNNAPIDITDEKGRTPLDVANELGVGAFMSILEAQTNLFVAIKNSDLTLLKKCIQENAILDCRSVKFRSPLQYAVAKGNYDIVTFLLQAGANVNYAPVGGVTALHYAAQFNETHIARRLLQSGANFQARTDKSKKRPVDLCSEDSLTGRLLKWVEEAFYLAGEDATVTANQLTGIIERARNDKGHTIDLVASELRGIKVTVTY